MMHGRLGYCITPNIEVNQFVLKSTRYESAKFVTSIVTNRAYNVTCNEVKVLKLLLKYGNALLLLRYCTTLHFTIQPTRYRPTRLGLSFCLTLSRPRSLLISCSQTEP